MKIIGLTGSIGMGKSHAAKQWRSIGVPVHDADKCVHDLLKPNGAGFSDVKNTFPSVIKNGEIDRKALGQIVFKNLEKRKILESILHPLVRKSADDFVKQCRRQGYKVCILDIPLLFETGRDKDMDKVLCMTAPRWVQVRRVLKRPHMTQERFKAVEKSQLPDYRKRLQSDYVINSARGRRHTLNAIKRIKKIYEQ